MSETSNLNFSETLRNGLAVTIRALRSADRERVAAAVKGLDRESIYTRLFSYRKELTEAGLDRIMTVDPDREVALLVTVGADADENVIGSGRYVASDAHGNERSAEVAFIVEEDYQGLGIASRILACLADIARARGITAFEADVLGENKSMLRVFARSGLPMQQRREETASQLRIWWAWNDGKGWRAPDYPRLAFGGAPALFKMYVVEEAALKSDASEEFLRVLLPALDEALFTGR